MVPYLQKLLKRHGFDLEPKPVVYDGVSKTYFLGTAVTQSSDRFEVSLGMEGYIAGMVSDIAETTADFVPGWSNDEQEKLSWETSHTYAVPMKPGLMLVPPASDDECLTKEDFPYRRAIGALLWLANVRPDISQAVRQLARHCLRFSKDHVKAVIHLLKYCYATRERCITYSGIRGQILPDTDSDIQARTADLNHYISTQYSGRVYQTKTGEYVDRDYYRLLRNTGPLPEELAHIDDEGKLLEVDARSLQYTDASFQSTFDYKSVSGYCIFYAGAVVDWGSLTQKVIATSTMESELIATQKAVTQMVHVRNLLGDLNEIDINLPTVSFEDNKACKIVLNNPRRRKGAKHMGRTLAKAHQWVSAGVVQYVYCKTKSMIADVLALKPGDSV